MLDELLYSGDAMPKTFVAVVIEISCKRYVSYQENDIVCASTRSP